MSRTALYRFYDDTGDLLYVGISVTPWARWKKHKSSKDWAEEVRTTELEWFDSRPEAMAAEKAAIIAEEPRYNIQHSTRVSAAPVPELVVAAICTVCGQRIEGAGTVQIDLDAVFEAQEQEAAGGLVSASDLMRRQYPSWEVLHYDCDPDPDRRLYVVHIDDVRSLGGLLETTAHLMEKRWISATNWSEILRAITTGSGEGPLLIPEEYLR